jgi:hypothetical protein
VCHPAEGLRQAGASARFRQSLGVPFAAAQLAYSLVSGNYRLEGECLEEVDQWAVVPYPHGLGTDSGLRGVVVDIPMHRHVLEPTPEHENN